jgi:hypothetical protein
VSQARESGDYVKEKEKFNLKAWFKSFSRFKKFKLKHKHLKVPGNLDPTLSSWIQRERKRLRNGELPRHQVKLLQALGVQPMAPHDSVWDEMFKRLKKFKGIYSHTNVTATWQDDIKLGRWVAVERMKLRRGWGRPDRDQKLKNLGLEIRPLESKWMKMYLQLKKFKAKTGHLRVPQSTGSGRFLHGWAQRHRRFIRLQTISKRQIDLLKKLGMTGHKSQRDRAR